MQRNPQKKNPNLATDIFEADTLLSALLLPQMETEARQAVFSDDFGLFRFRLAGRLLHVGMLIFPLP